MFNGNKYISALIMCQLLRPCTKGKTAAKLKPVHFTFASWLQQRNPPQLLEQLKENTSVHFKKWYQWNLGTSFTGNCQILAPRQHFGRKQRGGLRKESMCSSKCLPRARSTGCFVSHLLPRSAFVSALYFCFCFTPQHTSNNLPRFKIITKIMK